MDNAPLGVESLHANHTVRYRSQGSALKNEIHDLGLVLDSRVKLILIESWDEPRVLQTLSGLAIKRSLRMQTWSVTSGLQSLVFGGGAGEGSDTREPDVALKLV